MLATVEMTSRAYFNPFKQASLPLPHAYFCLSERMMGNREIRYTADARLRVVQLA